MNLSKKTDMWVKKNIISKAQREQILEQDVAKKKPFIFGTFIWLSVFCFCLGAISLITAHWHVIPDMVKLIFVFVVLGSGLILSFFAIRKERYKIAEIALFITFLMIGGGIGLIAQIFNLPVDSAKGLLLWAVLSFGIVLASKRKFLALLWIPLFLGGLIGYMKLELLLLFFEQSPLFATTLMGGILICLIYLSHFFTDKLAESLYHWSIFLYFPVIFLGDISMQNSLGGFFVSLSFLGLLLFFAVCAKRMVLFHITIGIIVARLLLFYFQSLPNLVGTGILFIGIGLLMGLILFFLYFWKVQSHKKKIK
ncbi:MAG: DUF2157 domain-containing protein [Alphaproteobacteria bacterium]|mgnify:CR=1 FL=1|nr:DUF2157 domain-containing protein [Alphaproteobacteria bacterium]MBR3913591.1 DUF2157 domain-containing protein [Alphaproteobacteria bacterium]